MTKILFELVQNNKLELSIAMDKGDKAPELSAVKGTLNRSEFASCKIDERQIKNLLKTIATSIKSKVALSPENPFKLIIGERIDSNFSIKVATNRLSATMKYTHAFGGKVPNEQEIDDLLKKQGISHGIKVEVIDEFFDKLSNLAPGEVVDMDIAEGREAVDGNDGYIQFLTPDPQVRVLRPQKRDDGTVDMRDLGKVVCVGPEKAVAKLISPTNGVPGITISGDRIQPKPGKAHNFKASDGTEISSENPNILVATKAGLPIRKDDSVEVVDVYEIKDVNISTGHIEFDGSVMINGDVKEGMKVVCTGDVLISGCVESAYICSGGDVTIGQGVIGHQNSGDEQKSQGEKSAIIEANGKISAKYVNYATLIAKDIIHIEKQLLHCNVIAFSNVFVGREDNYDGSIIGGSFAVGKPVFAGVVGTDSGSVTEFNYDSIYQQMEQKNQQIEDKLKEKNADLAKISTAIEKEKQSNLGDNGDSDWMQRAMLSFNRHNEVIEKLKYFHQLHQSDLKAFDENVEVTATKSLHKEVVVIFKGKQYSPLQSHTSTKLVYRANQFKLESIV